MSVQNGKITVHLRFDQHNSIADGTVIKINTHSITVSTAMDAIIVFDAKTGKCKNANHWINPLEAQRAWEGQLNNAKDAQSRRASGKKRPGTIVRN